MTKCQTKPEDKWETERDTLLRKDVVSIEECVKFLEKARSLFNTGKNKLHRGNSFGGMHQVQQTSNKDDIAA